MQRHANSVVANESFSLMVTVYDQYGMVYADYSDAISFSSNDGLALLPQDHTFVPELDHGLHVFTAAFGTAGVHELVARSVTGLLIETNVQIIEIAQP